MFKFKKIRCQGDYAGWSLRLGAFRLRWFGGMYAYKKGFRLTISFSRDIWIRLFGFNQMVIGL